MLFLGMSFFGDGTATKTYPVDVDNVNYIELVNGLYDDLYISKDLNSYDISSEWNSNTSLHAAFDNNTIAGNMKWYVDTIKEILIKRVDKNNHWTTIYDQTIETVDDFYITYKDYLFNSNTDYRYAIVPITHDNVEGGYIYATDKDTGEDYINVEFKGITIIGKDKKYTAYMELSDINTTRNQKVGIIEMMYNPKPKIFINSEVNYDSGNTSGFFAKMDENCDIDIINSYRYQQEIIDFLTDGEPKLLKGWDGINRIIMVTGKPTITSSGDNYIRIISFDWVEVGDAQSEKDLYKNNLSEVTEEYWSNFYK